MRLAFVNFPASYSSVPSLNLAAISSPLRTAWYSLQAFNERAMINIYIKFFINNLRMWAKLRIYNGFKKQLL
jgi:hypothetical protein